MKKMPLKKATCRPVESIECNAADPSRRDPARAGLHGPRQKRIVGNQLKGRVAPTQDCQIEWSIVWKIVHNEVKVIAAPEAPGRIDVFYSTFGASGSAHRTSSLHPEIGS